MPPNAKSKSKSKRYRPRGKKVPVYKKAAPASMATLKKVVKSQILKSAETKSNVYAWPKSELYHNIFLSGTVPINTDTIMPVQGLGDNQRIGDEIDVSHIKCKLLCGQKYDRPQVSWRFTLFSVPLGTAITTSVIRENLSANVLLDDFNTDNVRVLKSWYIHKNTANLASGTCKEITFPVKFTVPIKKHYKFTANAGFSHQHRRIYLAVEVYDQYGSLITDNIAYMEAWTKIYYKDL